jgi:hypothetical protein
VSEEKFGDVTCKNCKKILPANEMTKVGKRFACSPECLAELGAQKCARCSVIFEGYSESNDIIPLCSNCESWGNEKPTFEDFESGIPEFLLDEKVIKKRKKSGAIVWVNVKKWPTEVEWVYDKQYNLSFFKGILMAFSAIWTIPTMFRVLREGKRQGQFGLAFYWAQESLNTILTTGDRHDAALWLIDMAKLWNAVERKEEGFDDLVAVSSELKALC